MRQWVFPQRVFPSVSLRHQNHQTDRMRQALMDLRNEIGRLWGEGYAGKIMALLVVTLFGLVSVFALSVVWLVLDQALLPAVAGEAEIVAHRYEPASVRVVPSVHLDVSNNLTTTFDTESVPERYSVRLHTDEGEDSVFTVSAQLYAQTHDGQEVSYRGRRARFSGRLLIDRLSPTDRAHP
jgi:hypothetical protein